ncbi:hypothetical protein LEP1GSC125_1950 [Leptospira mayottensis 200901122]|uniref:Uncharacterized protein n=1 Tax=Leptospira mayottensis 200901122 TaxID=1193010 RepID=A0AA87MKE0_9LEPT|nr:hypothetical protein LEP1GSC125_1950 [Leptospira mayottensis 200901122]
MERRILKSSSSRKGLNSSNLRKKSFLCLRRYKPKCNEVVASGLLFWRNIGLIEKRNVGFEFCRE